MDKKGKYSLFLFIVILISYIVSGYILLTKYNSIDIAGNMILISAGLTAVFILSNRYIASIFSSFGILVSFLISIILKDIGTSILYNVYDNVWPIWLILYSIFVIIGIEINMFHVKHSKKL